MDWAAISNALTHLETLGPEDLALELERLGREDADLKEQIEGLRAQGESARFFMQTHMPDNEEAPANRLNPGDRLGIWEIGTLLGSGGMGEVYEARRADGLFEQRVALKLARNAGAKIGERFEAERQRLAQLEHPNIARIVDGGTTQDNAPYMTMEFVDGSPIDRHCRVAGLDRKARLNLVLKLCAAVSHAHGRLVLHRDIKHDNVLITAEGELRLIDFGVASLLDDPADEGRRGPVTFAYAAPEQLLGNPVSAATDIFAIGMLIHLLEAGSLPVRQSDAAVTIDTKRIADPDLDAVLAKATSFDPADRYGSVNALHDDLSSYLGGFAVAARPVSAVTKFTKLVARNKLATAMGGAAIAAVIAGVVGVGIFAVRANDARVEAELRAEAAEYFLAETNYANEVARVSGNVSQQFMVESQGINEADFRQFLIETADKTRAVYKENPEVSSAQVLFVARYLSNRGDYAKSKDMLAFLIAADETPDIALQDARVIQARNLRELGETKRAEGLLRDVLAVMKQKPYLFESPGYAQVAVNLALSSQGKEDLEDAVRANLVEATKPDTDKAMRAYFYNALAVLTSKLEDFDKTIEYGIKSVEYSKQAADTNAVSVNTRSLNLVGYILHHKKDVKLARSYWPGEADVMDPEKGHLRHRSMHRLYEAYALQIEGDAAAAYEKAKTAHELAVGEYPPGSPYYLTTAGMAIETGALAGKADEVRPLLESMMTPLESEGGKPHARAMIAHAFLLHAEGKRKQASEKYRQLDRARVRGSLELTYKAELLERELGIDS